MSLKKPDKVYPSSTKSTPPMAHGMPSIIPDPSLYGDGFNQLINNRGIRFIHKKAVNCPNLQSLSDNSHFPGCPVCDGSGIYYFQEKEIFGAWAQNTLEKIFEVQGVWEVGTAVVSFPTDYSDGTQADFDTFDKLVCPDFEVRLRDLFEYEPRSNSRQRMRYPINTIEHLSKVVNNTLVLLVEGVDYNVVDGDLEWIAGREPAYNEEAETGEVISISYMTNPVFNILNVLHELRATQEMGDDGIKRARRLQQQVLVKRDFLINDDRNKRETSDN